MRCPSSSETIAHERPNYSCCRPRQLSIGPPSGCKLHDARKLLLIVFGYIRYTIRRWCLDLDTELPSYFDLGAVGQRPAKWDRCLAGRQSQSFDCDTDIGRACSRGRSAVRLRQKARSGSGLCPRLWPQVSKDREIGQVKAHTARRQQEADRDRPTAARLFHRLRQGAVLGPLPDCGVRRSPLGGR